MCCVTNCNTGAALVNHSGTWGLSGGGICQTHWNRFDTLIRTKPVNVPVAPDPQYVNDYIRLIALMQDTTTVDAAMARLESEVHSAKTSVPNDERFSGKGHTNYVRLSRVLECYEGYCWFPILRLVYSGAVPAADFQQNLASGYMPKDPGASARHGDFSHRLQWHAVMRVVTNGFITAIRPGWDHSPFELYTSLGSAQAVARGLWGAIFDNQNSDSYQNPAVIESELRNSNLLPVLTPNLQRRYNKRKEAEDRIHPYLVANNLDTKYAPSDVFGVLYRWRKVGGAPRFFAPTDPLEKVAWHFWHWWQKENPADYEQMGSAVVLKKRGETVPSAQNIAQRHTCSRNALNASTFTYNALVGASWR